MALSARAILRRIRIYPPMLLGALLSVIIATSMVQMQRVSTPDLVVLPFTLCALIGGILALSNVKWGNWMLLVASLGLLALGSFFHYARIRFMLENGGMEGPGGLGSPLAFLIGWVMTTIFCFIPGLAWSIWNVHAIRNNG